jgi:hypothetical protein
MSVLPTDLADLFWSFVSAETDSGCREWLRKNKDRNGYGRFVVKRRGVTLIDKKAHRYAYELHFGSVPSLLRHTCDNPPCVNPYHLLPGNHRSNAIDARDRGLLVFRSKVLTDGDRVEIKRLRADTQMSYPKLATLYGVSYETIRRVLVK